MTMYKSYVTIILFSLSQNILIPRCTVFLGHRSLQKIETGKQNCGSRAITIQLDFIYFGFQ